MKIFTRQEVRDQLKQLVIKPHFEHDNSGQLVLYTGLFEWRDGTIHDEEEPE